jgi:hypothetical protein
MSEQKVINLLPGDNGRKQYLGALCFEDVVPTVAPVAQHGLLPRDRKSTKVYKYALQLSDDEFVHASKFAKIEHMLGEHVPCKPDDLPIVVRKLTDSTAGDHSPSLDFECLRDTSSASLRVEIYVVNAHRTSPSYAPFIDFMNEWQLMMSGVEREKKRERHAAVENEYKKVVDEISNDFKAKMAAASEDDFATFKEFVRQKGATLVPFKHQYVAVKAMLDMECPPAGESFRDAVATKVAEGLWYDMSSGQFVDDSFRGGMCNLAVGLGKTAIMFFVALANDDVVLMDDDLFFGGTVVVVPSNLLPQWTMELVTYRPGTVVTTDRVNPGKADFLIVDRNKIEDLRDRKVFRLVFDESHALNTHHVHHRISAQYCWTLTATPKRGSSKVVGSFSEQLRLIGLHDITLKGCNVVDGLLAAKMRKLVVNVDQSVAAHLFPKVVETVLQVPRSAYDVAAKARFMALMAEHPHTHAYDEMVDHWETRQGSYNFKDLIKADAGANGARLLPKLDAMAVVQADDIDDCPICFELCDPCVQTPCGHRFCHDCLSACLKKNALCPYCRRYIVSTRVVAVRPDAASATAPPASAPEVEDTMFVFSSLIDKAVELVVQNARKTIVFVDNSSALNLTRSKLTAAGVKSVIVPAKTTLIQNRVDRFVQDPACKCIVLNMKKLAFGLNLVVADQIVFVNSNERDPNFEVTKTQAVGRINRIGQLSKEVRVVTLKSEQ